MRRHFLPCDTVRSICANATLSIAEANRTPFSDDFNPSLTVGFSPLRETVYLTWAFTDAVVAKTSTAAVAVAVDAGQPIKNLFGVGTIYATGGNTSGPVDPFNTVRFGDFSSVSADPTTSDCAFASPAVLRVEWKVEDADRADRGVWAGGHPAVAAQALRFCRQATSLNRRVYRFAAKIESEEADRESHDFMTVPRSRPG